MPLINGNYIHPNLIIIRRMSDAVVAHQGGQFNYAIQQLRIARNIALYEMDLPLDSETVHKCTSLISLNYQTMRERRNQLI